jgi:hypothetical protein
MSMMPTPIVPGWRGWRRAIVVIVVKCVAWIPIVVVLIIRCPPRIAVFVGQINVEAFSLDLIGIDIPAFVVSDFAVAADVNIGAGVQAVTAFPPIPLRT